MDQSYYVGDAVRIGAELRDSDDALMDPDTSVKVTITDPDGTFQADAQDMTNDGIGLYSYVWQSLAADPVGIYRVKIVAIDGSYTALVHPRLFELKEGGV